MSHQDRWLLPEGIEEILPDEARRIELMRRSLLATLESWGYEQVMPPLIEYLDALLAGVGERLDLATFKLTDQLSGRMMGVRADMTGQTARIDAHYLKRKGPARLCYVGPVLRTRPDDFAASRELLQIGAELFGSDAAEADAEVLSLMIGCLKTAGIDNAHIDLGHVGLLRALSTDAGLNAEQEAALFDAMQRKAESEAAALLTRYGVDKSCAVRLLALMELNGDAAVISAARKVLKDAPASVLAALDNLEAVAIMVGEQIGGLPLHFDLAELTGYGYHTGIVFSAYVPGHGSAIANGGRYDGIGAAFGRPRPATGFGMDLRALMRLSPMANVRVRGILAPEGNDVALNQELARLRAAGERVVRTLPGQLTDIRELGCDRALVRTKQGFEIKPI